MTNEHERLFTSQDTVWKLLDDEWPSDPNKRYTFYNEHLDIYTIDTLDGISNDFKKYQQAFGHIMDKLDGSDHELRTWMVNRHSWTHYCECRPPPKKSLLN